MEASPISSSTAADLIPSPEDLRDAFELELQASDGHPVRLGELVLDKGDHVTTIIVFVRHFFCAYDQDYVRTISEHLSESILRTRPNLSGPCQLLIIGCGHPSMIIPYVGETASVFPVYSDPDGKMYEKLNMHRTTANITNPPSYTRKSFLRGLGITFKQMWQNGLRGLRGGPWDQNGGEWIFRGGKCVFVHRMEHVSDHLSAQELLEALKKGDADGCEKGVGEGCD
ncbi:AhpC/TSA antioxidant enzyme-domain-containing protein [Aspergillus californicus]